MRISSPAKASEKCFSCQRLLSLEILEAKDEIIQTILDWDYMLTAMGIHQPDAAEFLRLRNASLDNTSERAANEGEMTAEFCKDIQFGHKKLLRSLLRTYYAAIWSITRISALSTNVNYHFP